MYLGFPVLGFFLLKSKGVLVILLFSYCFNRLYVKSLKASKMAKSSRRIALYELVNKARFKSAQQKALSSIGRVPVKPSEPKPEQKLEPGSEEKSISNAGLVWSIRPKVVRFYPDRMELCLSWQVAIIGLLALGAIFLVFFRLGQIYSPQNTKVKKTSLVTASVEKIMPQSKIVETAAVPQSDEKKPFKMVEPMGDNVLVITSYDLSSHLEPVKQYFAQFGIATEIIKKGSRYLLVTQDRFDNIEKTDSDGSQMKKKIMSIGANYKPPAGSGFESFGTKPFQDVYGMKTDTRTN
jgi:hypothetical protein